ncbi:ABC transporter permease [Streptomyces sp. NPDC046859]|uniref:ABC transporter permease n=1 Tax=Streptomyces sp. NPDC046859 TaxID=3155734 RepID=UPI0033EE68F2
MAHAPVLHSEWLKIRTLRSLPAALVALFAVTTAFSALAGADTGDDPGSDPLFTALFGVLPGQIAAVSFGALAMAAEYHGGALRVSLAAVPQRGRWYAAKLTAVAVPVLLTGLVTAATALAAARADGLTGSEQARAIIGCGLYLMLMALFAAGLTAVFRSGATTLSLLIPFVLVVSFVVGDSVGTVADFLPDKAGQTVLHRTYDGSLGPWSGLAVTALWAAAALLAGAWSVRRRDT